MVLFDPFAGSGTTILTGQECGVDAYGTEAHEFVARVAAAKLLWGEDAEEFLRLGNDILGMAERQSGTSEGYPALIQRCFPPDALLELDALKSAWRRINDGGASSRLCWLALTSIPKACSPVGTSQMELIQPNKQKQNCLRPTDAFLSQIKLMHADMRLAQITLRRSKAMLYQDDARTLERIEEGSVNLVITSPPYANNFDYADATRFEMTFWGEIDGWGDLQDKIRRHLVRSCSQHMTANKGSMDELLRDNSLSPIRENLAAVCERLSQERLKHGGKKNYHLMVAAYFADLANVWKALRRVCRHPSQVCFVIGDSAPYGVYVPVHTWLGELALAAGFKSFHFEKTRDRNTKWKNRKHSVPLCEGRLWVEG